MPLLSDSPAGDADEIAPLLDSTGWFSLAAGLLVALITFFTSYSHVDLFGILHFAVNQQIGIPLLLAAVAALFGEVKLASNSRCADQSAREQEARARDREERAREREARARDREQRARDREARAREREARERFQEARAREREANEAAREREQTARRHRIQARCLVAQCRFLLADTSRNRLQLNQALALLMEEIRPEEG